MSVTGNEFLKRVKRYSKANDLAYRFEARKGKGSHGRLYVGSQFTTIKDRKKELGKGLLSAMLDQLDIKPEDF